MKITDKITITNEDNLNLLSRLKNNSVDIICIDPPYLYLKNQKLEVPFCFDTFFSECKRVLAKNGFIVMFGRGVSFYRWNTILDDLGFTFKEEIIWNKSHCTSPLMRLSRVHETISIFTKGKGTINKVKVPYLEMKGHDLDSVIGDVKRMKSILKNTKSLDAVLEFLENNTRDTSDSWKANNLSISSKITKEDRSVSVTRSITEGLNEKSIIRTDLIDKTQKHLVAESDKVKDYDRCVNVTQSICFGLNEKSIIKQVRDHYSSIHPTQKPVRLLVRLINLVLPQNKDIEDVVVADFFGGSMSTMRAVHDIGCMGISCELHEDYYTAGVELTRKYLRDNVKQLKMF